MTRAGDKLYRDIALPPTGPPPPRLHFWRWLLLIIFVGSMIGEVLRGLE